MKASQLTTRNKSPHAITRSLLTVTLLTFFAAGPAHADCNQMRIKARYNPNYATSTLNPNAHDIHSQARVPLVQTPGAQRGYNHAGWNTQTPPNVIHDLNVDHVGDATFPINDPEYRRKKEEERAMRDRIIEGLKQSGVIRERTQPSTTTTPKPKPQPTQQTTPKPKPKPKKPKVTKLPNGDVVTDYPDGRREVKLKNGDTVTNYPNGKRVIKKFGGGTTETHPSGYRKTTNRYGNGKAVFPDGTVIDFKSTGEATLTRPDGRKFHRKPGKGFKEVE